MMVVVAVCYHGLWRVSTLVGVFGGGTSDGRSADELDVDVAVEAIVSGTVRCVALSSTLDAVVMLITVVVVSVSVLDT